MDKRLIFPQNVDGRRDVYFVREDRTFLRKHASSYHPKIASYIENAKPIQNLVQVLLTALGAYEFWGQNVNGDRFRVPALTNEGSDYGYQTFKTDANYFTHHVNKDPSLAKGKVLHSVWNNNGKRVELIVGIDPGLDPEGAAAVERGEDLTFSMGAKVPFDVCSICGNRAKTRADYCEHLKYLMNQIDPLSNQLVGADNLYPKFFDISRVLIPADKTAHMWAKVASAENPYRQLGSAQLAELPSGLLASPELLLKKVAEQQEEGREKLAVSKKAAITKRVEFKTTPEHKLEKPILISKALLQSTAPSVGPTKLSQLGASLVQILSTLAALGMEPTPTESQSLPSAEGCPDLGPEHFHPGVASLFLPLAKDRSFSRPLLVRRIIILAKQLEDKEPAIVKKAESIRELVRGREPDKGIHPAYVAGVLAAIYALFGPKATGLGGGIRHLLSEYPYIALPLGASAVSAYQTFNAPMTSGFYSVDANQADFYNRNWQSRFAQMQARPVTVLKTGAAQEDTQLIRNLFYGVPSLYLEAKTADVQLGKLSHFIATHDNLLNAGLLGEDSLDPKLGQRIGNAIDSGKRIIKSASIRDLEFLEAVPETERILVWDLAILDAADRITKQVLGG